MRAVIQLVKKASVSAGMEENFIGRGMVCLIAVKEGDGERDAVYLADKIANLRIFPDEDNKMNHSLIDIGGEALAVPQFTLYGDCSKGRRPSFEQSADFSTAKNIFEIFVSELGKFINVKTGMFGRHMELELINDGPVTIIVES